MTENGTVKKIEGKIVTITCGNKELCSSCKASICTAKGREFQALNSKGIPIQEGDIVDIFLPPKRAIASAFIVLIVPLILFIALYILSGRLFGIQGEGMKIVVGLAGIAIGFGISYLYSKMRKQVDYPEIIQKL